MSRYSTMLQMYLAKSGWKRAQIIKKKGIFHAIGEKCYYHPRTLPSEPFLVSFGDNVFVGTGVYFATHNMVNCVFRNAPGYGEKLREGEAPIFGRITVGDNVFIGAHATVMHGVTIGSNCVVGANAVVTKDVPHGSIVAGCPAKVIGSFDDLFQKYAAYEADLLDATKDMDGTLHEKVIRHLFSET